jgi:hypothetical protein
LSVAICIFSDDLEAKVFFNSNWDEDVSSVNLVEVVVDTVA